MSSLVWTSDAEPVHTIAKFIASLSSSDAEEEVISKFCSEAEALSAGGKIPQLVDLLLSSAAELFAKASDRDAECAITVITSQLDNLTESDQISSVAAAITEKLTAEPAVKPALKIKLLLQLFNRLPSSASSSRVSTFLSLSSFASAANTPDSAAPALKFAHQLTEKAGLPVEKRREILLSASKGLRKATSGAADASALLVRFLETFSGAEGEGVIGAAEVEEAATQAAVDFLSSPSRFQSDLLSLPAVARLSSSSTPSARLVHSLLSLTLTQSLKDLKAFAAAGGNAAGIQELGLSLESLESKLRILSLASLADQSPSPLSPIPYATVAQALQVSEDDVEGWVVEGVTKGVVRAKMDEPNRVIVISRVSPRVFGPDQWAQLRTRLAAWKENLASVSRTLQQARESAPGAPVAAAMAVAATAASATAH